MPPYAGGMRSRVVGLAAVLVVLAAGGQTGQAAHPGANGDVVFVRMESGPSRAAPPLGLARALHGRAGRVGGDAARGRARPRPRMVARRSEDRVLGRHRSHAERVGVRDGAFLVDADGTGLRRLTANARPDRSPAWSPDGSQIAFVRDDAVWILDVERGRERKVTKGVESVAWSPDGRWLALTRGRRRDPPRAPRRHRPPSDRALEPLQQLVGVRRVRGLDAGRPDRVRDLKHTARDHDAGGDGPPARHQAHERLRPRLVARRPLGRGEVVDSNGIDLVSANGSRRRILTKPVEPVHDHGPDWQPICVVQGGPTGDVVQGSPQADVICGREGADRVDGRGGSDRLFGGAGNDVLEPSTAGSTSSAAAKGATPSERTASTSSASTASASAASDAADPLEQRRELRLDARQPLFELGDVGRRPPARRPRRSRSLRALEDEPVAHLLLARPPLQPLDEPAFDQRVEHAVDLVQRRERVQALRPALELAGRLRAAEHEHGQDPELGVRHRERLVQQVPVLHDPAARAAREPREALPREPCERRCGSSRRRTRPPGSRFVDWLHASRSAFSVSGYTSGVVRCFSTRQPRIRISTASASTHRTVDATLA